MAMPRGALARDGASTPRNAQQVEEPTRTLWLKAAGNTTASGGAREPGGGALRPSAADNVACTRAGSYKGRAARRHAQLEVDDGARRATASVWSTWVGGVVRSNPPAPERATQLKRLEGPLSPATRLWLASTKPAG